MQYKSFYPLLLAIVLLCNISCIATAQDQPALQDSVYSSILGEERAIEVIYPKGHNPQSPQKYEVLYCLEGVADFARLEYNFLNGEGFIPNLIIIGLPNTVKNGMGMRDRDFTPTHTYEFTGGANKFLAFLKDELLPYIAKKYPVKASGNTLYGGSLSGLFVVYAFLNEPSLFTSYMAVDPSLWWDNFYPNKLASKKFDSLTNLHNSLWIAGREGSAYNYMGTAEMDSLLHIKAPTGLTWRCAKYQGETHYSTQFKGVWDGLKFSYAGFYASEGGYPTSRKIAIKPNRGMVAKNSPFGLICYNVTQGPYIHYTTDDTQPTASSPALTGDETRITLSTSAKIIVKSIGVRPAYDRVDTAYFEVGDALPGIAKPEGIVPGGLNYKYYEGSWDTMPAFAKLKALKAGQAGKDFDLGSLPRQTGFALQMEGYMRIDNPGNYILELGGTYFRVYINNQLILGGHNTGNGENYMLPLEKGFYPLRIEYLHKKDTDNLEPLYIKPDGIDDYPVPVEVLYGK